MTDRPIIFSAPMVRALLDGRKTQTRRVLTPQPESVISDHGPLPISIVHLDGEPVARVTIGNVITKQKTRFAAGDRLWVRETWATGMSCDGPQISYRASKDFVKIDAWDGPDEGIGPSFNYDKCPGARWHDWLPDIINADKGWRTPIHMPRWASRLTLIVEAVKAERLQDISEEDAVREGCFKGKATGRVYDSMAAMRFGGGEWACARDWYADLWEQLHGADAWKANPWVVAIGFRAIKSNIDALEKNA